eukprot:jgi/Bigna1/74212/fgenesh1_pg.28_\
MSLWTGWVRACLPVKDLGLLFTVGCNFIKIWSMNDDCPFAIHVIPVKHTFGDFRHLGDLRVNRDILCLAAGPVAGGEDRSLRFILFAGLADGTIVMWELPSPSEETNNTENLRRFVPNHEAGRIKPHSSRVVFLDFDPATATLYFEGVGGGEEGETEKDGGRTRLFLNVNAVVRYGNLNRMTEM